jgi:hypothetical protein
MIESTGFAVALACGVYEREVARLVAIWPVICGVKKKRFQRYRDLLRETDPNETTGRYGVALAYQPHSFPRRDDLSAPGRTWR